MKRGILANRMAQYSEILDPNLQARVRNRYRSEIASLETLGFRHLACTLEALGNYSAILNFPILLLTLGREVIVIQRPLRLAVANELLSNSNPPAIALCMGMGVKFYTAFSDKTLLISSDFNTYAKPHHFSTIMRLSPFPSIQDAWQAHREHVSAKVEQGVPCEAGASFRRYVEMSIQEEDLSQYM